MRCTTYIFNMFFVRYLFTFLLIAVCFLIALLIKLIYIQHKLEALLSNGTRYITKIMPTSVSHFSDDVRGISLES